ncbi:MAG: transcription-repair coupling factor, partial [Pseudomonadota bacterium]
MTRHQREVRHLRIGGAPEGFEARLLVDLVGETAGPVLHVARDDARRAAMAANLAFWGAEIPVLHLPAWDCLPYDRISPAPDVAARRMATLATFAAGFSRPVILLTTLNAVLQRVPARETVAAAQFTAEVGRRIDEGSLRAWLVRMGFQQAPTVTEPGDFAIRGGLIDIYPPGDLGPVRLDLFGDVLDGVRRFDAATQRTVETVQQVAFAPVSEVILDPPSIQRFRQNYRATFGAAGTDDALYEAVSAGRKHQGMEHWLPFFHERLDTVFDYLPGAPVMLDDQIDAARDARHAVLAEQYGARRAALADKKRSDSVYKPVPPEGFYLSEDRWEAALADRAVRRLSPLPTASGPGVVDAGARIGRSFAPERQQEAVSLFAALAQHIETKRKTSQVVLAGYSTGSAERLAGLLEENGVEGVRDIARARDIPDGTGGVFVAVWPLETGFEAPRLTVIAEQDILGDRLVRGAKRRKRAENFLQETTSLAPGDLIVHV